MSRLSKCAKTLREYPLNFGELRLLFNKNVHTSPSIDSLLGKKADPKW